MSLATDAVRRIRNIIAEPLKEIDLVPLSNQTHTRIFFALKDVNEKDLIEIDPTPLYESGDARKITRIMHDGMWVTDYYHHIERMYKTTIFDLTDREIDEIGNLIVKEIEKT